METSQVLTVFNKRIHHEDDSSDDKSVIKIEPPKENGEQEIGKRTNSLLPHSKLKLKTEMLKGSNPIQQSNKYSNSRLIHGELILNLHYELKCTIHAILQHMGFNHTAENPCVKMSVNHKTKSCECIIIHQDELYIASSTLQEILHIVKEKYKI